MMMKQKQGSRKYSVNEKHNQTKFLVLRYLTMTLIISLALTTHPNLAGAQNKTLVQPTETKGMGTNATNINIVLVHGA